MNCHASVDDEACGGCPNKPEDAATYHDNSEGDDVDGVCCAAGHVEMFYTSLDQNTSIPASPTSLISSTPSSSSPLAMSLLTVDNLPIAVPSISSSSPKDSSPPTSVHPTKHRTSIKNHNRRIGTVDGAWDHTEVVVSSDEAVGGDGCHGDVSDVGVVNSGLRNASSQGNVEFDGAYGCASSRHSRSIFDLLISRFPLSISSSTLLSPSSTISLSAVSCPPSPAASASSLASSPASSSGSSSVPLPKTVEDDDGGILRKEGNDCMSEGHNGASPSVMSSTLSASWSFHESGAFDDDDVTTTTRTILSHRKSPLSSFPSCHPTSPPSLSISTHADASVEEFLTTLSPSSFSSSSPPKKRMGDITGRALTIAPSNTVQTNSNTHDISSRLVSSTSKSRRKSGNKLNGELRQSDVESHCFNDSISMNIGNTNPSDGDNLYEDKIRRSATTELDSHNDNSENQNETISRSNNNTRADDDRHESDTMASARDRLLLEKSRRRNINLMFWFTLSSTLFFSICQWNVFDAYLAFLAKERGYIHPNTWVGWAESVSGFTSLVMAVPVGICVDSFCRVKTVRFGGVLGILASILFISSIMYDQVILIFISLFLFGAFAEITGSATMAIFVDSVQSLGYASSEYMTSNSMLATTGLSVGPMILLIPQSLTGNEWSLNFFHLALLLGVFFSPIACTSLCMFSDPQPSISTHTPTTALSRRGSTSRLSMTPSAYSIRSSICSGDRLSPVTHHRCHRHQQTGSTEDIDIVVASCDMPLFCGTTCNKSNVIRSSVTMSDYFEVPDFDDKTTRTIPWASLPHGISAPTTAPTISSPTPSPYLAPSFCAPPFAQNTESHLSNDALLSLPHLQPEVENHHHNPHGCHYYHDHRQYESRHYYGQLTHQKQDASSPKSPRAHTRNQSPPGWSAVRRSSIVGGAPTAATPPLPLPTGGSLSADDNSSLSLSLALSSSLASLSNYQVVSEDDDGDAVCGKKSSIRNEIADLDSCNFSTLKLCTDNVCAHLERHKIRRYPPSSRARIVSPPPSSFCKPLLSPIALSPSSSSSSSSTPSSSSSSSSTTSPSSLPSSSPSSTSSSVPSSSSSPSSSSFSSSSPRSIRRGGLHPSSPSSLGGRKKNEKYDGYIPYIIATSDFIRKIGAGMTVKFFPLFFIKDYNFSPLQMSLLFCVYPLCISLFMRLCQMAANRTGRAQAVVLWQICGISCLFLMISLTNVYILILCFLIRGAFSNAAYPLDRSIINDYTESKHRGKWNAVESLTSMTWSGSAIIGGFLADYHNYRYTFKITAIIYIFSLVVYLPLLWLVPRDEKGRKRGEDLERNTRVASGGSSRSIHNVSPQLSSPQSSSPQSSSLQSSSPQPSSLQSSSPQSSSPQSSSPQSTSPQSTSPQSTSPQSTSPQSTSPQSTSPQSTSTQSSAPQSSAPHSSALQSLSPQSLSPQPSSVKSLLSQKTPLLSSSVAPLSLCSSATREKQVLQTKVEKEASPSQPLQLSSILQPLPGQQRQVQKEGESSPVIRFLEEKGSNIRERESSSMQKSHDGSLSEGMLTIVDKSVGNRLIERKKSNLGTTSSFLSHLSKTASTSSSHLPTSFIASFSQLSIPPAESYEVQSICESEKPIVENGKCDETVEGEEIRGVVKIEAFESRNKYKILSNGAAYNAGEDEQMLHQRREIVDAERNKCDYKYAEINGAKRKLEKCVPLGEGVQSLLHTNFIATTKTTSTFIRWNGVNDGDGDENHVIDVEGLRRNSDLEKSPFKEAGKAEDAKIWEKKSPMGRQGPVRTPSSHTTSKKTTKNHSMLETKPPIVSDPSSLSCPNARISPSSSSDSLASLITSPSMSVISRSKRHKNKSQKKNASSSATILSKVSNDTSSASASVVGVNRDARRGNKDIGI